MGPRSRSASGPVSLSGQSRFLPEQIDQSQAGNFSIFQKLYNWLFETSAINGTVEVMVVYLMLN